MSRNKVEVKDQGWNRIQKEVKSAKGSGVKVGVLSDSGTDDEGADMTLIAAANEFGTDTIPARPFVRGAFDKHRRRLHQTKDRLWWLVIQGRITVSRALALLGEEHQGQVQEYMTELNEPANAPSTVRQKGSSNPLIDEGRLKNSVRWERDN